MVVAAVAGFGVARTVDWEGWQSEVAEFRALPYC